MIGRVRPEIDSREVDLSEARPCAVKGKGARERAVEHGGSEKPKEEAGVARARRAGLRFHFGENARLADATLRVVVGAQRGGVIGCGREIDPEKYAKEGEFPSYTYHCGSGGGGVSPARGERGRGG